MKRMTAYEVINKQEDYRRETIRMVRDLYEKGLSVEQIAEQVGIGKTEANAVLKINRSRSRRSYYRKFF